MSTDPAVIARDRAIFDKVMSAVNVARRTEARPRLYTIVRQCGLRPYEWNNAWTRTRERSPETAALLYRALGKSPPTAGAADEAECDEEPSPEPELAPAPLIAEPESEPEPEAAEEDDEAPSEREVLGQVIAWLERAAPTARPRIVAAAGVFLAMPGASRLVEA